MSSYFELGNLVEGVNSTATSGGTLALVASSKTMQRFTGTQNHTVTLPNATTFQTTGRRFSIKNRSTGTITVNNFVGTLIATMAANTQRDFFVSDISTSAGVWELVGDSGSASGGGAASVQSSDTVKLLQGLAVVNYGDSNIATKRLKINPELMGADVWVNKTSIGTVTTGMGSFELGGYGYVFSGYSSPTILTTNQRYHDDNNYWQSRTAIGTASYDARGSVFNGYGYGMGGFTNVASTTASSANAQYSDLLDSWTSKTAMTESRADFASFVLGGYMFAACGTPDSSSFSSGVQAYSDTPNAWYVRASYPDARAANRAFVLNDAAYSVSGFKSGGVYDALVYKYSSVFNTWIAAKSVSLVSRSSCAAFSSHGSGYAAGGYNGTSQVATSEQYNDFSNAWLTRASMSEDKYRQAPFVLSNFATIAGGNGSGGPSNVVSTYKNASMFYLGSLLSSASVPTTVLVAAATKSIAADVSVQVRTDGDTWRLLSANVDSALKTGDTLKSKFAENHLMYALGGSGLSSSEVYSDQSNVWTTRASAPSTVADAAEFNLDGHGYYAGGQQAGSTSAATVRYNDITNAFTTRSGVLSVGRYGMAGNSALLGYGYAMSGRNGGGTYVATSEKYSSTLDSWTAITGKISAVNTHINVVLHDRLYAIGGENAGYHNYNEQYDPATNAWASKAVVSSVLSGPGGFTVNDFMYHNGGSNGATYVTTTEKYNDQTNTWASATGSSSGRFVPCSSRFNGAGYIYGGAAFPSGTFTSTEKFNDAANTWSTVGSMNTARSSGVGLAPGAYRKYEVRIGLPAYIGGSGAGTWVVKNNLNSSTSINGGWNLGGVAYKVQYNAPSEKYDLANDVWRTVGSRSSNGASNGADFALQGYGYIAGGAPITNSVERMNPATDVYTTMTSLAQATYIAGSSSVNGYGYVIGGTDNSVQIANNQQYNQTTNAWASKTVISPASQGGCFKMDALNGYIYHINQVSTNFNRYSDAADSWSTMLAWPGGGSSYTIANEFRGDLVTIGGYFGVGSTISYAYKDSFNAFILRSSLATATYSGMSCNLNGTILSAGGYNSSDISSNQTQQFIPTLNDIVLGVALEAK